MFLHINVLYKGRQNMEILIVSGKPQKRFLFLVDSPLTGGGGVGKGLSTKEKILFLMFFFLICSRPFDH